MYSASTLSQKGFKNNNEQQRSQNRTLMMNLYLHMKLVSHSVVYLITLLLFLYIVITTLINHSSTPNFLISHLTTWLGTRSNAFSRFTKAKKTFFNLIKFFKTQLRYANSQFFPQNHFHLAQCLQIKWYKTFDLSIFTYPVTFIIFELLSNDML